MNAIFITFILSCSAWLCFELWLNFHDRRNIDKTTDKNTSIHLFLLIVTSLAICITVQFTNTARIPISQDERFGFGIVIIITGSLMRWWSIWYLGKYFQTVAAIQDGQKILKSGLYRFIRHPSYTGAMLVFLGFGLGLGTWIGLAVMVIFPFVGYYRRIKLEEQLMVERFKNDYISFMAETKKLIPFIY